jgi:hypothetical protein
VKSWKKCGISNALNGTEVDVLFEERESSDITILIMSVILVKNILGDSVTSRNFILHCLFLSKYL